MLKRMLVQFFVLACAMKAGAGVGDGPTNYGTSPFFQPDGAEISVTAGGVLAPEKESASLAIDQTVNGAGRALMGRVFRGTNYLDFSHPPVVLPPVAGRQRIGRWFLGTNAYTPVQPLLPAPVLRWNLNEGSGTRVADSSGNGYHAVITGKPLPFWINGPNGVKAVSFVSNLDYSQSNPFVGTGQVICSNYVTQLGQAPHASLCAWMESTNFGDYCSCGFGQSYRANFMIDFTSDEQYVYVICANGALNTFRYWVGDFPGWHFFCLTYDGTQSGVRTRLYIDGQLKATQTKAQGAPDTLPDAVALGYPSIASNVYDTVTGGMACDMQVFDVTLTPEQVMALFTAGAR